MKSYTQEEVNELLLQNSFNRVTRELQNLKDDAYTQGFSEGYVKGKAEERANYLTKV